MRPWPRPHTCRGAHGSRKAGGAARAERSTAVRLRAIKGLGNYHLNPALKATLGKMTLNIALALLPAYSLSLTAHRDCRKGDWEKSGEVIMCEARNSHRRGMFYT